jgi:hypothetical protein
LLGVLWGSLANSFLRNFPPQPLSAIQITAINVIAEVTPLACVIGTLQLGRLVQRLLAALRRSRARFDDTPARTSAQYEMDDSP